MSAVTYLLRDAKLSQMLKEGKVKGGLSIFYAIFFFCWMRAYFIMSYENFAEALQSQSKLRLYTEIIVLAVNAMLFLLLYCNKRLLYRRFYVFLLSFCCIATVVLIRALILYGVIMLLLFILIPFLQGFFHSSTPLVLDSVTKYFIICKYMHVYFWYRIFKAM